MTNSLIFRLASSHDCNWIYQSLQDMISEQNLRDRFTLTHQQLHEALFGNTPIAEALLVCLDDQPIGLVLFCQTQRNFILFPKPGIYIHDLYIIPKFRRKKIGTQLFQKMQEIAQNRGCGRLDWVVLKQNQQAYDFYETIKAAREVDYISYYRFNI